MRVVQAGHESAQSMATATRNTSAERGVGRAYRHEANMLPQVKIGMKVVPPGRSWRSSRAVEVRRDLTGKPGQLDVHIRSGNMNDAKAIGLNVSTTGWAGLAADAPPVAPAPSNTKLYVVGGIALAAAFLLFRKK